MKKLLLGIEHPLLGPLFKHISFFEKKIDFNFKKVIVDFFYAIFMKDRKWLFSACSHTLRVLVVSKSCFSIIQTFRTSKGPSNAVRSQFIASETHQNSLKSIIQKKYLKTGKRCIIHIIYQPSFLPHIQFGLYFALLYTHLDFRHHIYMNRDEKINHFTTNEEYQTIYSNPSYEKEQK